ncbi:MAG: single-stranded-DNA-specific exonuclease RecJ [Opitutales bacterium]
MQWNTIEAPAEALSRLNSIGVHPVVARLLASRGFESRHEAEAFLHPKLAHLRDPFEIHNLRPAVERILRALEKGERILIFGDYDVDGITSTVLLVSILRQFGSFPRYAVPLRLEEGYGLNRAALERAIEVEVPDLLIAVDCGTKSIDEVAWLRSLGVDVVLVDHHRGADTLPLDCVIVNPHVSGRDDETSQALCAVGLTFKVIHGLLKELRERGDRHAYKVRIKDYLDLVALGTIADLVPLRDENRILARHGLGMLAQCQRQGVRALFDVCGLSLGQPIRPTDISFRIGPRINASGRLADATVPIEMLLCEDFGRCAEAASDLDGMNRERQEIERTICAQAEAQVLQEQRDDPALVVFDDDWHTGVVGIVAGKLARQFNRPAVVLGREGQWAHGSGRSVPGINLVEAMSFCAVDGTGCALLGSWGGHPMAVGVAVQADKLTEFRTHLHAAVKQQMDCGLTEPCLPVAGTLRADQLGAPLLKELELMEPYGEGNPEPIFAVPSAQLVEEPVIFGEGDAHFRFHLPTTPGRKVSGVAWGQGCRVPPVGEPVDLAVKLAWNVFNGRRFPQIELVDWKLSKRV